MATKTIRKTLSERADLLAEWDFSANEKDPESIALGSDFIAVWTCPVGHSYTAEVKKRTRLGHGCRRCHELRNGTFAERCPDMVEEWATRNKVKPDEVAASSHVMIGWVCKVNKKHRWTARPTERVRGKGACPFCTPSGSSLVERSMRKALIEQGVLKGLAEGKITLDGCNSRGYIMVDVTGTYEGVPFVIEYDGERYHGDRRGYDSLKTNRLLNAGYLVVRIRENKLPLLGIQHPGLRQINFSYSLAAGRMEALAEQITVAVKEAYANLEL